MGDVREIDLEYQGYTLVGLWNLLMCERGQHKKQLTTLQAEKERLELQLSESDYYVDSLKADNERLEGELGRLRDSKYLVWSNEHAMWWAPDHRGYRFDHRQAGRYTLDEAVSICNTRSFDGQLPSEIFIREDLVSRIKVFDEIAAKAEHPTQEPTTEQEGCGE